ncbi:reverse transcriptase domain-containing protein [Tanacetum coccineum]
MELRTYPSHRYARRLIRSRLACYFDLPKRIRMPSHVKTYDGSEDPKDHLKIFQAAAKAKWWAMPTWCHMFNSTLTRNAKVWFDDLLPESIDSYDDLKEAFLANYLQQKKCIKDPVEIHHIKQREGESTEDFVRRFKIESMDVKRATEERKKTFPPWKQQDVGHKQNFKKGGFKNQQRSEKRQDKFALLTKTPKEILALDKGKFKPPPPMTTPMEKRNASKLCEFYERKLSHLIKELKQNNRKDQAKVAKKGEAAGKDKPLAILMVQAGRKIAKQRITQTFSSETMILFPPLGDEDGTEGPMVIKAEVGGHLVHCMRRGTLNFRMDELHGCKIAFSVQRNNRKSRWPKTQQPVVDQGTEEKIQVAIHPEYPEQIIAIDMTGVPRHIAEHRLNVREGCFPVRQKKRGQASERNKAICEKVEKLVNANFKDLNKACPKDGYQLPEIDWKVESLCGYPFKCFLDAYKGYHQIKMAKEDEEKTTFITSQGIFCYSKMPFGLKMSEQLINVWWIKPSISKLSEPGSIEEFPMMAAPQEKEELIIYLAAAKEAISAGQEANTHLFHQPNTARSTNKADDIKPREHDIQYRLRTSVKGQILADFIVERPEDNSEDTLMEDAEELPDPWILFTDGSSCTDGFGAGLILTNPEGMEFTYALRFRFDATNNEAEYEALIAGLKIAEQIGVENLQANVESRLVANQVNGTYVAKETDMIRYLEKVKTLTRSFKAFSIKRVPRNENKKADALSKIASTSFAHLSKQVLVEELKEKSISAAEVLAVVEEEGDTWMTPIFKYLTDRTLPAEGKKERAVKRKSWRFSIINGILYTKSFLGPWLRCVGPLQANYVLREIHEGSCSMHAGTRSVVAKALRIGYYWPTMHEDARKLIQACQDCQVHKPVPRNPQQKLSPITSPWPFYKWGIDIAEPFPERPEKVKFLIVAIDYFTKWIEAKPVATITGSQIKKFVWDNIVCRFGLPGEIISDNGKQFQDNPFKDWCEKLCIRQHFASVKHPQTNGLVEKANHSLGEGIKARLDERSKNWIEELPHVLWAHRTMIKSSNGDTPFSLTYGTKVVIPAELGMPTLRTTEVNLEENKEALEINLDLLEERREQAAIREAKKQSKR